eukprot:TRINITY_DN19466_c0_g1_i1.p1 TRINITY_DN19466_c0_g1~~TRINITY_DN19466_c0_g1_i1.p1  ORF type:complete len:709 (+),score=211.71 TRINITY_DN19466_c0_g1_i1:68-2128(+)
MADTEMSSRVWNARRGPVLLPLIDDLRDELLRGRASVSLPMIALLGTSPIGRAELLSQIAGVRLPSADVLPCRAPLVLWLRSGDVDTSVEVHVRGRSDYVQAEQAHDAILRLAAPLAEDGVVVGRVSEDPVCVRVVGRRCADLTVVDLPSIQKEDVAKDEHEQERLRDVLRKYVRPAETLVACAFPEPTLRDLPASEALALAREVDPAGDRTVGVLVRASAPAPKSTSRWRWRPPPVPEAFGGGAAWRIPADDARAPTVTVSPSDVVRQLCDLQVDHVRRVLPLVGSALRSLLQRAEARLIPLSICVTPQESMSELQRSIDSLRKVLWRVVHGDYQVLSEMGGADEAGKSGLSEAGRLCPRIDALLAKYSSSLRENAPRVFEQKWVDEAVEAVSNTSGRSLPNFLSDEAFRSLMRRWHRVYIDLTQEAFKEITRTTLDVLTRLAKASLGSSHPSLRDFLLRRVVQAMKGQIDQAHSQVERALAIEGRVVYTINPHYQATLTALRRCVEEPGDEHRACAASLLLEGSENLDAAMALVDSITEAASGGKSSDSRKSTELQLAAFCYNRIVQKRLADSLMQIVHFHYVEYVSSELGFKLADGVTEDQAHDVLRRGLAEEQERAAMVATQAACQRCIRLISKAGLAHTVPDDALPRWALPADDWSVPDAAAAPPQPVVFPVQSKTPLSRL